MSTTLHFAERTFGHICEFAIARASSSAILVNRFVIDALVFLIQ